MKTPRRVVGGASTSFQSSQGTVLLDLTPEDSEYQSVEEQMQSTIREHKDRAGGLFQTYKILKVGRLFYI